MSLVEELAFELGSDSAVAVALATGHVADALDRLRAQFREKPNIETLLAILVGPIQSTEDAFQQLLNERSIDTAIGVNLDNIGLIVGQLRNGYADDDYRRLVRARIATNMSDGSIERMIKIARLVIDSDAAVFHLTNEGNATQILKVEGLLTTYATTLLLMAFIMDAQAAGVRTIVETYPEIPAGIFTWDLLGAGWDEGILPTRLDMLP